MEQYVSVNIADLRREPSEAIEFCMKDPLQETQLLYGDEVRVLEAAGDWARVEVPGQQKFTEHRGWQGYPGWIKRDQLSSQKINSCFSNRIAITSDWIRQEANGFLGSPYFWGGCSFYSSEIERSGVDCSGLVYLIYHRAGLNVPRDAHDQWLKSRKIAQLQPGDLVFTAPHYKPDRFDHVMLFVEGETLLEASLSAGVVRYVSFEEKLGHSREALLKGAKSLEVLITFGSLT
jgi:cell wall-associated NlpC family hydrolase